MATKVPHPPPSSDEVIAVELENFGRSRTSLKKERINNELALSELAAQLLTLSPGQLIGLGLSELAMDAIKTARLIKSFSARDRQMRLVRARLRDSDWMQIRAQLDQRRAGFIKGGIPAGSEEARIWTEQLLVQGDPGLARFVEVYEKANRQRIRQLVRTVNQSGEAKRHKARLVLLSAVEDAIANRGVAHDRLVQLENSDAEG